MTEPPVDQGHPPDEPPPGVAQPLLWRLAVRLYRDHDRAVRDRAGGLACALCRQPWPCRGRRLAQHALAEAWLPACRPTGRNGPPAGR